MFKSFESEGLENLENTFGEQVEKIKYKVLTTTVLHFCYTFTIPQYSTSSQGLSK